MYMRKPRTFAETRESSAADADGDVPPVRAKRKGIPDAWDDLISVRERSWKRHRGTQHRA